MTSSVSRVAARVCAEPRGEGRQFTRSRKGGGRRQAKREKGIEGPARARGEKNHEKRTFYFLPPRSILNPGFGLGSLEEGDGGAPSSSA